MDGKYVANIIFPCDTYAYIMQKCTNLHTDAGRETNCAMSIANDVLPGPCKLFLVCPLSTIADKIILLGIKSRMSIPYHRDTVFLIYISIGF